MLSNDLVVAVTYADIDYLGIADVWWCELTTGTTGGGAAYIPLSRGIDLPDRPGSRPLRYRSKRLALDLTDDEGGTTLTGRWTERGGAAASLDLRVGLPADHESLNVVIPWSDERFQYTSKHQARPARGTLVVGSRTHRIDGAWGVLDVGRGRWPYRTRWNWGGGAGRSREGSVVGLQFGGKWTEGTGHTENGVIVDGVLTKIGEELEWTYDWERPRDPWRVRHPDGSLDLTLHPRFDRHTRVDAGVLATEVHQVFGRWSGHVTTDAGAVHHVEGVVGFAEESRSRW